jgi:hypothetical protein
MHYLRIYYGYNIKNKRKGTGKILPDNWPRRPKGGVKVQLCPYFESGARWGWARSGHSHSSWLIRVSREKSFSLVCLLPFINSTPTRRIYVKFVTGPFYNLTTNLHFSQIKRKYRALRTNTKNSLHHWQHIPSPKQTHLFDNICLTSSLK